MRLPPFTGIHPPARDSGRRRPARSRVGEAARQHAWRDAYELPQRGRRRATTADDLESLGYAQVDGATRRGGRAPRASLRGARRGGRAEGAPRGRPCRLPDYGFPRALAVSGRTVAGERLLADEPEGVEHGHLALMRGTNLIDMGELERAAESFHRARELAGGTATAASRRPRVFEGVIGGWTGEGGGDLILDEAIQSPRRAESSTRLLRGSSTAYHRPRQALGDCGRASEGTEVANRWCDRLDVTGFPGHAASTGRRSCLRATGRRRRSRDPGLRGADDQPALVTARGVRRDRGDPSRPGASTHAEEAHGADESDGTRTRPSPRRPGKVDAAGTR